MIYVGDAESSNNDQTLEEVMVGPVPVGVNKFVLQADPPNHNLIPKKDWLGVTVVLITCSYLDQEFIRIGYYVNNESSSNQEENMSSISIDDVFRNVLSDKPRVTRFPIQWEGVPTFTNQNQQQEGGSEEEEDNSTGMYFPPMNQVREERIIHVCYCLVWLEIG